MVTRHHRMLSALTLAALSGAAFGQSCPVITKFDGGASAATGDSFGQAVSMSFGGPNNCPLIAVGEPYEDAPVAGDDAGGFTIYQKPFGSWVMMYDAWNTTGQGGEQLGASISLSDPYLIAGAPMYNSGAGRAVILRRPSDGSGYTGPVNVQPGLGAAGSAFGRAVAISSYQGGWAVVGAPLHDFHGEVDAGAAFFYTRDASNNTWNNVYTIWGSDFSGRTGDHRGTAVAMAQLSEYAAIGSPDRELTGQPQDHGTVRIVYRLANGLPSGQSQEVAPPSPEAGEHFGAAVAIENDILVVGAPDEDMTLQEGGFIQAATDGGAIYIFQRTGQGNTWNFVSKLRSPTPTTNGHFGAQVSTDGAGQIIVSEPGTKRVFVFTNAGGSWRYQAAISDPDAPASGAFGSGVAVRNGDIAIGDSLDDNNAVVNPGAVYMLSLPSSVATGDRCSDPIPVGTDSFIGCTSLATPTQSVDDITTCGNGGSGQGNDVWFSFTPECSGNAIFDTLGSQFDTVLSVHSSCPLGIGGNTTIVCNDDASFPAPNNRASLVTFNFTGGQTYLVRVTGYNGASGEFTLRHLYTFSQSNDTCATASTIGSGFGTTPFNNCAATTANAPVSSCGGAGDLLYRDIWYRWIAPMTQRINVDTCGSSFDTVLAVYQGTQQNCPQSSADQIVCNDDSTTACGGASFQSMVTFQATAGQSYLIRIGGFYDQGGPGQLTIQPAPCAADFNHDTVVNSQDFFDFLTAFFAVAPAADFNADTLINSQDFFDFLTVFFAGC